MSRTPDPYVILGVDPGADDDAVKRAYRRGVLAWHPDVSSAPDACERLRQVQWAWEKIGQAESRRGWDEQVARQRAPSPKPQHFRRRPHVPVEPLVPRAGSARDLHIELELTADEAARGLTVPMQVLGRELEIVVPRGAADGIRGSMWLGGVQLHVILRVV